MVASEVIIRAPRQFAGGTRPSPLGTATPPLLLERTDARFMGNVRQELMNRAKWNALKETIVDSSQTKLYQPIHRTFYVTLIELVCDTVGQPRLDPTRIDSSGMVIRRVARKTRNGGEVSVNEGWMEPAQEDDGTTSGGWQPLVQRSRRTRRDPTVIGVNDDPDAKRRRIGTTGNEALDRQLATLRPPASTLSESVSELFVLPPGVAEATGATLLFGLMPTASMDTKRADPAPLLEDDEFMSSFPIFLQEAKNGGGTVTPTIPSGYLRTPDPDAKPNAADEEDQQYYEEARIRDDDLYKQYRTFVQQMVIQYGLTEEGALKDALDEVKLPFGGGRSKPMGTHLLEAADVLAYGVSGARVEMPKNWVRPNTRQAEAIREAVRNALKDRLDAFNREENRFGNPGDRYVMRAFVRVRRDDGCPPDLYWTDPTPEFEIAQWYERGPAPMPIVQLPDPFAAPGLSQFKPNVGFALPSSIVDVVNDNEPDKLINGEGKRPKGGGIAWLCGFNIPLITLCAFIVLYIFLQLLNIIFWWLAFIKICIPIPRRG